MAFQIHSRVRAARLGTRAACLGMLLGAVALATSGAVVQAATAVITPATLNPLTVGTPVSVQLQVACQVSSFTTSGALPAGLTLSATTGLVSGTPTTAGAYSWSLAITCTNEDSGSITYSGTVAAPVPTMPTWTLFVLAALLVGLAARRLTTSPSLRA